MKKDETYNEFDEMDRELEEYEEKHVSDGPIAPIGSAREIEQAVFDEDVDNFFKMLGNKIRGERKYRKMSQVELSKLTGLSRPSIGSIEAGEHGSVRNLIRILMAIEVDMKFSWWCE